MLRQALPNMRDAQALRCRLPCRGADIENSKIAPKLSARYERARPSSYEKVLMPADGGGAHCSIFVTSRRCAKRTYVATARVVGSPISERPPVDVRRAFGVYS